MQPARSSQKAPPLWFSAHLCWLEPRSLWDLRVAQVCWKGCSWICENDHYFVISIYIYLRFFFVNIFIYIYIGDIYIWKGSLFCYFSLYIFEIFFLFLYSFIYIGDIFEYDHYFLWIVFRWFSLPSLRESCAFKRLLSNEG